MTVVGLVAEGEDRWAPPAARPRPGDVVPVRVRAQADAAEGRTAG